MTNTPELLSPDDADAVIEGLKRGVRKALLAHRPAASPEELAAWAPVIAVLRARLLETERDNEKVGPLAAQGMRWLIAAALVPGWVPDEEAMATRRARSIERRRKAEEAQREHEEAQRQWAVLRAKIRVARDSCVAASTHLELAAGLRAMHSFREIGDLRERIMEIMPGIERWPVIIEDIEANPGGMLIDSAKRIGFDRGWYSLVTARLAQIKWIERRTIKNRVRLWPASDGARDDGCDWSWLDGWWSQGEG